MTANISIQYSNAQFTAPNASITVSGGQFVLASNDFLQMSGTFTFNTLSISSGSIGFYNTAPGVAVNGTIGIPVSVASGHTLTITVNNFSGSATVSWPTNTGPQYQRVSAGDPITLAGFTG